MKARLTFLALVLSTLFFPALPAAAQDDPNARAFVAYLRSHWDDIHDVIMRFHNDDPYLKGVTVIAMTWNDGSLVEARTDSTTTGNPKIGPALISAMKSWKIPEISGNWSSAIPFRTTIVGSDNPDFDQLGILTGNIIDDGGNPIPKATLILISESNEPLKPDTIPVNREGVFIRTLIPPGNYSLVCSKEGYRKETVRDVLLKPGGHQKVSVRLSKIR
jgi:hypothetical protein